MIKKNKHILEIFNLKKRFNGITALNNVSLKILKGEKIGIIGSNGSGKTTLLNVLSRLIDFDEGEIRFYNQSYKNISPFKIADLGIARSFQLVRNFEQMSISDNILLSRVSCWREKLIYTFFNRKYIKTIENEILNRAFKILDFFEMNSKNYFSKEYVCNLSLGQQRVIELTRVFLSNPLLMLLDEPSVGLDIAKINNLTNYLKYYMDKKTTIIIVSHDFEFLNKNVDEIYLLKNGQLSKK
jgi:branched-chain amino acid transport system ATP-binding protein